MRIVFSLLLLCIASGVFCQAKTKAGLSTDEYLQKSKRQKTIGWVLLAGGAALLTTGTLIPEGEVTGTYVYPDWSDKHKNDGLKAALSLPGILAMLGSVPFFIASSKNKDRAAATVSIEHQKILLPQQSAFVARIQPALTLKIRL
jgi:4-amino-4-deoxy-L-arabinose transferase-like glycosyltransferase